jgi:tetratricopeptide (TPR) repeat protein
MPAMIISLARRRVARAAAGLFILLGSGCSAEKRVTRLLAQADTHYQASRYEQAEIEYKNVLQLAGLNAPAITRLGLIYLKQGRTARALPFLAKARELQPDDLATRLEFGVACLATGNRPDARGEAIFLLERLPASEVVPLLLVEASTAAELDDTSRRLLALPAEIQRHPPVLIGLGHLALRRDRPADAEEFFLAAQSAEPRSIGAQDGLGTLYWSQKKLPEAGTAFQQAADWSAPRSPQRLHYAQFKLQTGDAAGGRQLLEAISRETPDYLPAWVWLAEIAAAEKKFPESEALLGRALARDPLHAEALLLKARVQLARGQTDQGIAELERLLGIFPNSPAINYQLGLALATKGDAAKALARLLQVGPEMPEAVLAIGALHLRARDNGAAIAALRPLVAQRPDLAEARFLLAEALRANGELDEAAQLLTRLELEQPHEPRFPFAHGMAFLQQGRRDQARAAFLHLRKLAPAHFEALDQLVKLDLSDQDYTAARQRIEGDPAGGPTSARHALLLAQVGLAEGDQPAAEVALKRVLDLQPTSAIAHFQLAQIHLRAREPQKAIADLEASLAKGPGNLAALLLLGVIQDERGEYAAARAAYEKAMAIDRNHGVVLNNLAFLYAERFDLVDPALAMAQRAHTLYPDDPRTADTLGWILVRKKQYLAARPLLQAGASQLPREPEVHFHLGTACYFLGDEPAARAAFERALALSGTFSHADLARQRLALLELDPATPDARAVLEQQLRQSGDDPVARLRLADWSLREGHPDQALGHFQSVLKANPRHAAASAGVARAFRQQGDFPQALAAAKTARIAAPNDPAVTHLLGRLAFDTGDHRWSASLLDEASRRQPDDAEILYDRAMAGYSLGRVAAAMDAMRAALEKNPQFSRAADARDFLAFNAPATNSPPTPGELARFEQLARGSPLNVPVLMILAATAERERDEARARGTYERILQHYPDFAPAQRNLILLYTDSATDHPKAAALAVKARQSFPSDPAVARIAGVIAFRAGDFAKAAALLEEVAGKAPPDGEMMYYLGMAQFHLNRRSASKASLQRALALGVKPPFALEARTSLAALE